MSRTLILSILLSAACATSACTTTADQVSRSDSPDSVGDVLMTPANDLNLERVEIPIYLKSLEDDYQMPAGDCAAIDAELDRLDSYLGPDITKEMTEEEKRTAMAYGASSGVVGALIPFRGVVREITGASKEARAIQYAHERGVARRAFLKGIATERGCAM